MFSRPLPTTKKFHPTCNSDTQFFIQASKFLSSSFIFSGLLSGASHLRSFSPVAQLSETFTMSVPGAPLNHPEEPSAPLLSFLQRLQEIAIHTLGSSYSFPQKFYVDLSLKSDLQTAQRAFEDLPRSENGWVSAEVLQGFIQNYFNGAGKDTVVADPVDFAAEPTGFLQGVKNEEVRAWALEVHRLWKSLCRKMSDDAVKRPERHTLIPLPEPFVIAGSRYWEVYYWDSYWVIRGLLASKMYSTAKAIVTNLISLADRYGYVLNGARVYYTNRSQPPLLSAMVRAIYNRTDDSELVRKALPVLCKEHEFWTSGVHKVTVQDAQGCNHSLSRYYAMWNEPRPECATTDATASTLLNSHEKKNFYREVASAAESGWDFSSRWMRSPPEFTTLATTSIIPVDLNAFILGMELDIAFLASVTGNSDLAEHFLKASQVRKKAINSILWNENKGQWLDYWLSSSIISKEPEIWDASNQNQNVFASNFVPLWIEMFNSDESLVDKVTKCLQSSGLIQPAGIAASLTISGRQWDFPYGWAPLQHMIVEGLARSRSEAAKSLAADITLRWIRTNYMAFKETGLMHEKYDVQVPGKPGDGAQNGFGWTNGVVLAFLEEFGWPQDGIIV